MFVLPYFSFCSYECSGFLTDPTVSDRVTSQLTTHFRFRLLLLFTCQRLQQIFRILASFSI